MFYRRRKMRMFWEPAETAETAEYPPANAVRSLLVTVLAAVLFSVSAVLCFLDVFGEVRVNAWRVVWPIVAVVPMLFFFEIICRLRTGRMERLRFLVPVVYLLALAVYYAFHREALIAGTASIAEKMIGAVNYYYQLNLSFPEGGSQDWQETAFWFWFTGLLSLLTLIGLWWRKRLVFGILPLLVVILDLMVGYAPQLTGLGVGLAGVLCANAGEWQEEEAAWAKEKRVGVGFGARFLPVLTACALAALLPLACNAFLGETAQRLASSGVSYAEFQKELEAKLQALPFPSFASSGERITNRSPKYKEKEVLKLTASARPDADVYLSGFYGAAYEDGSWTDGTAEFEEACEQAGYDPQTLIAAINADRIAAIRKSGEGEYGSLCLEYTKLSTKTLYLPYFVELDDLAGTYTLSGDYLLTKKKKNRSVDMKGCLIGGISDVDWESIYRRISAASSAAEEIAWYDSYVTEHYLDTSDDVPEAAAAAELVLRESRVITTLLGEIEVLATSDLTEADDESVVAQNARRVLLAEYVQEYLSSGTYSWELDRISDGTDCVEYFLENERKGYCIHFASAATLILRELGVPARYASGYVVPQESFSDNGSAYESSILDSQAHAWVEIYLNGIGWVPVEVTPSVLNSAGESNASETADESSSAVTGADSEDTDSEDTDSEAADSESGSSEKTEQNSPETEQQDGNGSADSSGGTGAGQPAQSAGDSGSMLWRALPWLFAVLLLAGLALIAAAVHGGRKKRCEQRLKSDLRQRKNRRVVLRINRRVYRLLGGAIRNPGKRLTDAEYEKKLEERYPQSAGAWKRFMEIVKKAHFSQDEITDEEAGLVYRMYQEIKGGSALFIKKK